MAGCSADDLFTSCPLSASIEAACEADQATTTYTCVVEEHPLCNEQVCAAWGDSEPFCSRKCDDDDGCPAGSVCESYLTFGVCVLEEYVD